MPALHLFDPANDRGTPTVGDIIDQHLADRKLEAAAGKITEKHREQTARYLAVFKEDFGHIPISDCRRGDLGRWLVHHPEYKSPHTQAKAVGFVVQCFRWAEYEELIDRCPYTRPKDMPTCEPRRPILREEVRRILIAAKQHGYRSTASTFRMALWFLMETGCRCGEMRALRWEHYDDKRGLFELKGKTTRKTGRKRLIVLGNRAWRLIRWLRRCSSRRVAGPAGGGSPADQPTGHVFLNREGRPWDKDLFARRFRDYADAAGVPKDITAYSCRHGFCVERLESGVGERQIADLMGHASTKFVAWYGRGAANNVDYLRGSLEKE